MSEIKTVCKHCGDNIPPTDCPFHQCEECEGIEKGGDKRYHEGDFDAWEYGWTEDKYLGLQKDAGEKKLLAKVETDPVVKKCLEQEAKVLLEKADIAYSNAGFLGFL